MIISIIPIVEGQSEVESVPLLMRRLRNDWHIFYLEIGKPVRVKRYQVVREEELERRVTLAMSRPNCHAIVIVLDADDDCPKNLGPQLLGRAQSIARDIFVSIVMPKSELESWFVGSIESLRGKRGISASVSSPENPEDIRDAKGFLTNAMESQRHYIETADQPALAAVFNTDQAHKNCRSFRKFYKDLHGIMNQLSKENV